MPTLPSGGPRLLLRQMREVMAEGVSGQERLDKLVRMIAANMVAEVCSVYLLAEAGDLELFATEGLNPAAVHATRLKVGEGLVGTIAETAESLNLSDAPAHPKFAYRPETGEDPYRSLMGVPILRAGRTLGVLLVQNRTHRHYTDDEVEALEIIATVLAEVVASGEFSAASGVALRERLAPVNLHATGLADGIAVGVVVLHEPRIHVTRLIAEDVEAETGRLEAAIDGMRASIDAMLHEADANLAGESRDVLEAYRMFAHDGGWLRRLREAVVTGLTAEAAVERVQNETRARMLRSKDPYWRERLHDLEDLANRLLRHLTGDVATASKQALPEGAIILARSMGGAELLDYDRSRVRGVVLEDGTPTSHVAIIARALDIPMVGRAERLLERAEPGDLIALDGATGELHLRPTADVVRVFDEKLALHAQRRAQFHALRNEPAITLDGVHVRLNINAGLMVDLPNLDETGADGIGLFRTELQFMVAPTMPRLKAQAALYRRVIEAARDKSVVFRTLDLGGDKILPYGPRNVEANPAMGWRALRIGLDRPSLLRYQLRALIAAAEGHVLSVMFPMVAEVAEFVEARRLLHMELDRAQGAGKRMPSAIRVGAMIEVPSLVWQLDQLLPICDFVSVGSNDLMQFFFAVDRSNPRLTDRYDLLSPSLLRMLRHVVETADRRGVPLGLCGEMAGRTLEAMALVGIGFRAISMPPASIGPVKLMVRSLHASELQALMEELYDEPEHSLRPRLAAYASEHNIPL
ncbi:MAG: phosphoenolpyruvate--protein phosphotransferase [Alphaproteobacteria bacterium]|nr:phosphoenolpyruvate--protein phosphotransferase [Alphaproteobacteria bacterium]